MFLGAAPLMAIPIVSAFDQGGRGPVVGGPGRGRPYHGKLRREHFTKKGWEEYQALLAAEEAAEESKRAVELADAIEATETVLEELAEAPEIGAFLADTRHLTDALNAAVLAKELQAAQAREVALYAHQLAERIAAFMRDEEEAIELLLM